MKMGLKCGKCARPGHVGFTSDALVTRKGRRERKRGSNAGKGGRRGGLRYEFTIAREPPSSSRHLLFSSREIPVLSFSRDFLFLHSSSFLSRTFILHLRPPLVHRPLQSRLPHRH